jgi:hypothetical protein
MLGFAVAIALGANVQAEVIFLESGGQVVMEAENFSENIGHATHNWELRTGAPYTNARGDYLQSLPDSGSNNNVNDPFGTLLGNSPLLNYVVRISTPGEYQLYLRWAGFDGASDSIYGSIVDVRNGAGGAADWYRYADDPDDTNFNTSPWNGVGEREGVSGGGNEVPAVWTLAAGDHTVQVLRREDGSAIDALVLQLSSLAAPTGMGPPQSVFIPEPSSFALSALGLLGLVALVRRKRARS